MIDQQIQEKVDLWLNSAIDEESKAAIKNMSEDELADAFYKDLEFGTGGLRGVMGVGSNRMNKYTVGMATQGLANYLKKTFTSEAISVAIAHDSRNNSRFFAETTAAVFSANGIKVYLFEALRPTPELSYAIRQLGCKSGVVLTASHNPKEYNGYKAYWDDGAQVIAPHDKNIITEVQAISGVEAINFEQNDDLIEPIGRAIDEKYIQEILNLTLAQDAVDAQSDLKIVFSPIHGTSITLVPEVLDRKGFKNVTVVEEQAEPNGNFPTVVYPNPEEKEAMTMALNKAKEIDADLIMATDPDADRVGIAAKNKHGEFELLNGNQAATLLIYFLLKKWEENGKLTGKQMIVKTIVTSDILDKMAESFGVDCPSTLTGFKFIAAHIKATEGEKEFIGGGEESYGYMISDFVRDKDAIASCAMLAEMTAWAKNQGLSVFDLLAEIYAQYGFFLEKLISITKKGMQGAQEIQDMMAGFRADPPKTIAGSPVTHLYDYNSSESTDLTSGTKSKINLPKSNVLQFVTADGSKISARPSGTEPKIKFYISVNSRLSSKADYDNVKASLEAKIDAIQQDLKL
ncbi:phospho-sugar mutase [Roseivirga pacifica]|uniref:phospho-sugar mutase n=1 Tax=Roseivirga pacifica TaxID=1267423 RepID=UPI0020955CFF|nr:phospho-sugar mutase [Roseivirga pacifica]MCO6360692.1 phospho-sugar mutase [Roseivirga pacifica]MCO6368581.1 phospho-sugar mutase [Roseivirga pacifica]MCO6372723.1 phospho-sugar mutase [Roseivirga pacifica]MCO6376781.1 phospho-sugar mutase [Roseivirga pacifica]MCO6377939.1 phospho-sugar mutase [Roseivirga pacifica]